MLNIVLLNLNGGGAEKIGILQAQFLQEYGVEVRLVTFDNSQYYDIDKEKIEKKSLNFSPKIMNFFRLICFLIKNRNDKYILHSSWINLYVGMGCILLCIEFIVFEHNNLERRISYLSPSRRLVYKRIMSFVYRRAAHVYAVSIGLKNEISSFCGNSIQTSVLYNDVSRSIQQNQNLDIKENPVLLVGRNVGQKGFDRVIKLINDLDAAFLDSSKVVFVFIGVGVENLMTSVVDAKKKYVKCLSFTNDIDYYYKSSKFLLFSSRYEGFGNILLEAISFGLPVLGAFCDHGPSEILGKSYPTMSEVWDEDFIIRNLRRLVLDNDFYKSVSIESNRRAQKFDKIVKEQRKQFIENMVRL